MRKPDFCICENKDTDQLCDNRTADQRLCFHYIDSTIPLLSNSKISSRQPSCVVVQPGLCGAGRKPQRPVFSQQGSFAGDQIVSIFLVYPLIEQTSHPLTPHCPQITGPGMSIDKLH